MKIERPPNDAVRAIRAALAFTQNQMARELVCTIDNVRAMERQRRLPRQQAILNNLERLAKRAGVSLDAASQEANK